MTDSQNAFYHAVQLPVIFFFYFTIASLMLSTI